MAVKTGGGEADGAGAWVPPSQNASKKKGNVFVVEGAEDLLQFISEDERLSVGESVEKGVDQASEEHRTMARATDLTEPNSQHTVKVHASWCQACRKFDLRYRRLASEFGDKVDPTTGSPSKAGLVRFAEMRYDDPRNRDVCDALGANQFPHILLHKGVGRGKVGSMVVKPAEFKRLSDAVKQLADWEV